MSSFNFLRACPYHRSIAHAELHLASRSNAHVFAVMQRRAGVERCLESFLSWNKRICDLLFESKTLPLKKCFVAVVVCHSVRDQRCAIFVGNSFLDSPCGLTVEVAPSRYASVISETAVDISEYCRQRWRGGGGDFLDMSTVRFECLCAGFLF